MRKCLSSDDELFHVALYDWLIDTGLKERLLEVTFKVSNIKYDISVVKDPFFIDSNIINIDNL